MYVCIYSVIGEPENHTCLQVVLVMSNTTGNSVDLENPANARACKFEWLVISVQYDYCFIIRCVWFQ